MRVRIALLVGAIIVILVPKTLYAAGITLEPFSQEILLQKNDTAKSFVITLSNSTKFLQTMSLRPVDLGGLDDTGGLLFEGMAGANLAAKYKLASYIELEKSVIDMAPGESVKIGGKILNNIKLSPGAHYGAVLAVKNASTVNGSRLPISQALAGVILVRKLEGQVFGMTLNNLSINSSLFKRKQLDLSFYNSGNVHITPRGTVIIYSPFGKEVARAAINEQSALILPETSRLFKTQLMKTGSAFWPGRYKLEIKYRYDGKDSFETKALTFRYTPVAGVLAVIGALLGIIITILLLAKQAQKVLGSRH